jgi:predicted enzyme related to lactoylglutathione lyase
MAATLSAIVIDALDRDRVAAFWAAVLGWERRTDDDGDLVITDPEGRAGVDLLVLAVPEHKSVKNRLHIDLTPTGADQGEELERLLGLGAVRVDIGQGERSWIVLADPEGNEFCLLAGRAGAAGAPPAAG